MSDSGVQETSQTMLRIMSSRYMEKACDKRSEQSRATRSEPIHEKAFNRTSVVRVDNMSDSSKRLAVQRISHPYIDRTACAVRPECASLGDEAEEPRTARNGLRGDVQFGDRSTAGQ